MSSPPISALWTGPSSNGDWTDIADWSSSNFPNPPLGYVPGAGIGVDLNGATVTYDTTDTILSIGDGVLDMTGGSLTIESSSGPGPLVVINVGAGASLIAPSSVTVSFAGAISGTLAGPGAFVLGGGIIGNSGATAIDAGADLSVANLTFDWVTLNTNLTYGGAFTLDAGGYGLSLNSNTLTLTGTAALDGIINGPGTVVIDTTSASLGNASDTASIAYGAALEIATSINQNGAVQLGAGSILIDAGATYTLTTTTGGGINSGINEPPSTTFITNNGSFVDNSSGGTVVVHDVTFTNNGTLTVDSGDILQMVGSSTLGGTINGSGELYLGSSAQITASNLSVGELFIAGTTTLGVNVNDAGIFDLPTQGGTLDLNGYTLTLSGSGNSLDRVIMGPGTLLVKGAADVNGLMLGNDGGGNYAPATLEDAGAITEDGTLYLASELLIDAGATYTLTSAVTIVNDGPAGEIVNNGSFIDNSSGGTSTYGGPFYNNTGATLTIDAGDTFELAGGSAVLDGTINGAGTLHFAYAINVGGESATLAPTSLNVGAIVVDGGSGFTLGADLTYAGAFSVGGSGTINLNGYNLTLSGSSDLFGTSDVSGGTNAGYVDGGGTLKITGSTTLNNAVIGDYTGALTTLEDGGAITQTGQVNLRNEGEILIDQGATYTITAASAIVVNGSPSIVNNGSFIDDGSGAIQPQFINNGLIEAEAGTLSFINAVTGSGSAVITGGATLAFGGTFQQNVAFQGAGALSLSQAYGATVTNFLSGDAISLSSFGSGDTLSYAVSGDKATSP
ncbi:beta strand repeat-containing protein [Rhodoblastus sp.]|uniref:beta strand repeat-containing protein n=1 Tax=Rhodoblastus sp. TaxID=1962975 RepID=UPI003F9C651A